MIENGYHLLIDNAALLLVTALVFDVLKIRWQTRLVGVQRILIGSIIGIICILLMLSPWNFAPGIIFDTRSILLSISGLFFGLVPTIIAMVMASIFRFMQGGIAAFTGISVILATGSIGIVWRYLRKKKIEQIKIVELYLFGLLNHVVMLLLMLTLPKETAFTVLAEVSFPVLLIYPIATAILGFLLVNRSQRETVFNLLQEREEQLSLAINSANIGFFEEDLVNKEYKYSPEWKRQLGYRDEELSDERINWISRLHPEERDQIIDIMKSFMEGDSDTFDAEFRLRHKNGAYRWILSRGMIQRDQNRKAIKLIGCHVDVTDLKEFEDALILNERRFRSLAESSQDVITLFSKDYKFEYVNEAAVRLTGLELSKIIGKRPEEIFIEKKLIENLNDDLERVILTEKPVNRIGFWPTKNANNGESKLMLDWRLTPVRNPAGQVEWILGIARDITNLLETEAALKKSEEKFRRIFETSGVGISLTDLSGNFISGNPAILKMLGYTQSEYAKLNIRDVTFKEDVTMNVQMIEEYKSGLRESFSLEKRMVRKNGQVFWANLISTLVRDEFGKPLFTIGMMEDITSRKVAEEKEIIAQQELQDLLTKSDQSRQVLLSLIEDQKIAEKKLKQLTTDLIIAYDSTLEGWSHALELKEQETAGHSRRVVELTLNIAKKLGVTGDDLVQIERGALLHDIGKMGIPDSILLKPGPLTEEEWVIMRMHPVYANNLLAKIDFLKPALDIPYSHHERWDGSGYPQGLAGKEIPLAARIFAVVDIWDALSSDRPYRKAWKREDILTYIRDISGTQLDPEIVDIFLNEIEGTEQNV